MSEIMAFTCLLCDTENFQDGKLENHMKKAHGLLTNHITFFIAIHFLTKREREKIEKDMGERVKELSEDNTNPMAEEL